MSFINQVPRGEDYLIRRIQDIERTIREMQAVNTVGALLTKANLAVVDGALRVLGALEVTGTLSLPAGIIDNDALANPVLPATFYERADGWATTTTFQTKVTETLTTPAGFTKAIVSASAWATATNTTAVTDNMYLRPVIDGANGPADYISGIAPGASGSGQASDSRLVSGLTDGQTFTVTVEVRSGNAWGASAGNIAIINGTVLWFR